MLSSHQAHLTFRINLGTLYSLYLASLAGKKSAIGRLPGDVISALVNKLRAPTKDDPLGRLVIDCIIPAVSALREQVKITFSTMFSEQLLQHVGIRGDIEAGNLDMSDKFFDLIKGRCGVSNSCRGCID